jgi:carbamoylphosphate synthase large subunit
MNDLYGVLAKVGVDGQERLVLALYKAIKEGNGFKLTGVRMLGADLQIIEYGQDRPRVKDVLEELKKR